MFVFIHNIDNIFPLDFRQCIVPSVQWQIKRCLFNNNKILNVLTNGINVINTYHKF